MTCEHTQFFNCPRQIANFFLHQRRLKNQRTSGEWPSLFFGASHGKLSVDRTALSTSCGRREFRKFLIKDTSRQLFFRPSAIFVSGYRCWLADWWPLP